MAGWKGMRQPSTSTTLRRPGAAAVFAGAGAALAAGFGVALKARRERRTARGTPRCMMWVLLAGLPSAMWLSLRSASDRPPDAMRGTLRSTCRRSARGGARARGMRDTCSCVEDLQHYLLSCPSCGP